MQVYAGKVWKRGVASRGLYAIIRHPQYVSLAVAGVGLAILWPRFLTLVLLAVMLFLYYVLAKDEERRMLARHGMGYRDYMAHTGMFFPRWTEADLPAEDRELYRVGPGKAAAVLAALLVIPVGTGFVLRGYTIAALPLLSIGGVDAITITADDLEAAQKLIPAVLDDPAVAAKLSAMELDHRWLAYVIPIDYTMQGMIADTGAAWRLFEQHKTLPMITEYVIHPFSHLTEGHAHMTGSHTAMHGHDSPALKRRVIFVHVSSETQPLTTAYDDFGIAVVRQPRFFVDVHLHTGEVLQVREIRTGLCKRVTEGREGCNAVTRRLTLTRSVR